MKYLLNHKEMKAVDTYSIKTAGIPSLVLMERAALCVAQHLEKRLAKTDRVLAVSGSGNNGADAVAAARILYNKGYQCEVYMAASPDRISEELKVQLNIAVQLNMPVYIQQEVCMDDYDWLVDGVFGIGLSRNITGDYASVIGQINAAPAKVCAVDIPSGVFADNGQILGCAVQADMTVTFGFLKTGMVLYPGAMLSGEVFVEDIGFARGSETVVMPEMMALEEDDLAEILPERVPWSNKGTYGRVLVIAGKKNMCGAAYFCAKAACKMGTGLVKLAVPEENRQIIQTMLPEAVLETYSGVPQEAWIRAQTSWADVIVAGPGLGTGSEAEVFIKTLLSQEKPLVIDADGLNVLADHREWLLHHDGEVIVTPHPGEMSRLTGKPVDEILRNIVNTCKTFARSYHVTCVLKDARTVTADPEGHVLVNMSGNNGMSTGGSGDVLAGITGGLWCQKKQMPVWLVAAGAAYIHGLCGDEAKKITGVYGLLASDIIQYMSNVVR